MKKITLHCVKNYTRFLAMKTDIQKLIAEIEATADLLSITPSTVSERAGQGGHFYKRLKAGKRAWPETISAVRGRLKEMQRGTPSKRKNSQCGISHGGASPARQATHPLTVQTGGEA